jgi:actin-related protein
MNEDAVFVVDVGSSSLKAGYSGEDVPSFVFPSTVSIPNSRNVEVSIIYFFFSLLTFLISLNI